MARRFGDCELILNLNIEQLVLENIDIDPSQQDVLKAAVESEIARQISVHDSSLMNIESDGSQVKSVKVNPIFIKDVSNTQALGRQIGKAVFRGTFKRTVTGTLK